MFLSLTDTGNLCEIFFFLFSFIIRNLVLAVQLFLPFHRKLKNKIK